MTMTDRRMKENGGNYEVVSNIREARRITREDVFRRGIRWDFKRGRTAGMPTSDLGSEIKFYGRWISTDPNEGGGASLKEATPPLV